MAQQLGGTWLVAYLLSNTYIIYLRFPLLSGEISYPSSFTYFHINIFGGNIALLHKLFTNLYTAMSFCKYHFIKIICRSKLLLNYISIIKHVFQFKHFGEKLNNETTCLLRYKPFGEHTCLLRYNTVVRHLNYSVVRQLNYSVVRHWTILLWDIWTILLWDIELFCCETFELFCCETFELYCCETSPAGGTFGTNPL
jgi:hypothetical protein